MSEWHEMSALALGEGIAAGAIDPVALTEHFLARIGAEDPEHVVYLRLTGDRARAEAAAAAERTAQGLRRGPLDGVPISWKDIYDTAGIATEMGTPLMAGRVPVHDAEVLARATRAGLVCLGKTNTVQFALGGVGTNPHTGTPANGAMTDVPRAPGGSSSGAATSVSHGLAPAGIGSDTGGSVRIPAAWNGLVGLKTSIGRLPVTGVLPLSPSLDTVGPLTRTVADAAALFAVMAAEAPVDLTGASLRGSRFLVADSVVWDDAEPEIVAAVDGAIARIAAAGATVERGPVPEFTEIHEMMNRIGGVVVAEGYAQWRHLLDAHPDLVHPAVLERFLQGRDMSAADVETVRAASARLATSLAERVAGYDALLMPTVPIAPPPIAEVADDLPRYRAANGLALRNTRLGNVLPACALTVPCPGGAVPAGLMMSMPAGEDRRLLRLGAAVEGVLAE